jgi:hypothetical protein
MRCSRAFRGDRKRCPGAFVSSGSHGWRPVGGRTRRKLDQQCRGDGRAGPPPQGPQPRTRLRREQPLGDDVRRPSCNTLAVPCPCHWFEWRRSACSVGTRLVWLARSRSRRSGFPAFLEALDLGPRRTGGAGGRRSEGVLNSRRLSCGSLLLLGARRGLAGLR